MKEIHPADLLGWECEVDERQLRKVATEVGLIAGEEAVSVEKGVGANEEVGQSATGCDDGETRVR